MSSFLHVNKNDTKGNASEKEMQSGLHYKNTVSHQVCDGAIQIPQLIVYNGLVFSSKCIHLQRIIAFRVSGDKVYRCQVHLTSYRIVL